MLGMRGAEGGWGVTRKSLGSWRGLGGTGSGSGGAPLPITFRGAGFLVPDLGPAPPQSARPV